MKLWRLTWVRKADGTVLHQRPKEYDDPGNLKRAIAFHHHLHPGLEYELEEADVRWRKVQLEDVKL